MNHDDAHQMFQQMSETAAADAMNGFEADGGDYDFVHHTFEADNYRPILFSKHRDDTVVFYEGSQLVIDNLQSALEMMHEESGGLPPDTLPIERQHYWAGVRDAWAMFHVANQSLRLIHDVKTFDASTLLD